MLKHVTRGEQGEPRLVQYVVKRHVYVLPFVLLTTPSHAWTVFKWIHLFCFSGIVVEFGFLIQLPQIWIPVLKRQKSVFFEWLRWWLRLSCFGSTEVASKLLILQSRIRISAHQKVKYLNVSFHLPRPSLQKFSSPSNFFFSALKVWSSRLWDRPSPSLSHVLAPI